MEGEFRANSAKATFVEKKSFKPQPQSKALNSEATRVGTFDVFVFAHVALRMLTVIALASHWHFLAMQ